MTQATTPYVLEFLHTQIPGFKSRNLMLTADHTQWTDMIYWTTMETALAAMEQLHAAPEFREFAGMIDSQGIQMMHLTVEKSASGNAKEDSAHA